MKEKAKAKDLGLRYSPGWTIEEAPNIEHERNGHDLHRQTLQVQAIQTMVHDEEGGIRGEEDEEDANLLTRYIRQTVGSDTSNDEDYTSEMEDEESEDQETDEETE